MNNKQCILLSHVFVDPKEKKKRSKLKYIEFSVMHYKQNNPDAYIILTGHGLIPKKAKKYCDFFYWEENLDLDEIGKGHPKFVNIGIDHAINKGFKYLLKSRADSVCLIPNIFDWCEKQLKKKKYLVTQQSFREPPRLGDLFIFGELNFFKKCWDTTNWYEFKSGLEPHANNFIGLSNSDNLVDAIKDKGVFVDIYRLKWICFRGPGNWNILKTKKKQIIRNNLISFEKYLWGTAENWHEWDSDGNLIKSFDKELITEKEI